MQSQSLIKKNLYEVHKPSGQISAKLMKGGSLHQLTPAQFDSINFMCYKSREQMHLKYGGEQGIRDILSPYKTEEELSNFLSNHEFELNLEELSTFIGGYKTVYNRHNLLAALDELKEITVKMGLFKKHDLSVEHTFSLVRRYTKTGDSSTIKYKLEAEMMYGWLFTTKPFSKMYLTVQAQLKHTYSKILYENLKDYEKQGVVEKPLKLWNYILGFDPKIVKAASNVSTLKRDYLNKTIKDINNTTDIFIDSIEGKVVDGEKFMTVTFHIQDCDLVMTANESNASSSIFYSKSRLKLDTLIKNGYRVVDEEMWIETDIKKNSNRYESEIRIDKWLNTTEIEDKNKVYECLASQLEDCDDPVITIEDYIIKGVFSKESFTKNASETIEMLNSVIISMTE